MREKPADLPPLSDAQLEIMGVVWERRETTVGEVWKEIAARRRVTRNTVLTLMDRLARKGWLRRREDGNVHWYSAAATRKATLSDVVRRVIDGAFGGSAEELVLTLLNTRGVSQDEAERIRQMIDQTRKGKA